MKAADGLSGLNFLAFTDLGLIKVGVYREVLSVPNNYGFLHTGDVDHGGDFTSKTSPNGGPGFRFERNAIVANADILEMWMRMESKGFVYHGFLERPGKAPPVFFKGLTQRFGFGC